MARRISLPYIKFFCTATSFKIAVAFCTIILFIFSFTNYDTLRVSNWIQFGTDITRQSATDSTSRIVYLEDFATQWNPNDLHQVSVLEKGGSIFGFRLVNASKTAICPRQLKKLESEYQRTWLLSYPGSGNTWMRHLLQQLTGHYTGAVYNDTRLKRNGFPFEGIMKNVVAIKTHSMERIHLVSKTIKLNVTTDRIILVIRNPYNTILANFKREHMRLGHVGNAKIITDRKWDQYIMSSVFTWEKFILDNIELKYGKLIIYYEDLMSDLLRQLVRLANFIGTQDLNEFSFCCALREREGANHRRKSDQTVDDLYSKSNKVVINAMLTTLSKSIEKTHQNIAKRLLSYIKPL